MAADTMKVSNLSHAMHVLHGRCVPTTEFYYDGRWWPVAHATRARPFVELDVAVALRLVDWYGNPAEGRDGGLYAFTNEFAPGIKQALADYAEKNGGSDDPPPPASATVMAHPILGDIARAGDTMAALTRGSGGQASAFPENVRLKIGHAVAI